MDFHVEYGTPKSRREKKVEVAGILHVIQNAITGPRVLPVKQFNRLASDGGGVQSSAVRTDRQLFSFVYIPLL